MKPKPNKEEEIKMFRETDTPRIYVACLAAYNSGILHGKWIDTTQGIDGIWEELKAMLAASPEENAEEWAIHGYEGFGSLSLSEYEGIERVTELTSFIEEHDELGTDLLSHFCGDIEQAKQALDNYLGCFESLADYARELTEETTEIPQHLEFYIDYEEMGRDIELNGDVFTIEKSYNEIHVFINC
ncbi:antirestriction protein ArdA [Puniceicoccaceae bacterium K14]|nr:antirestriction protein ArdA [Puniceicoccaceae bacterium K14]